MISRVRTEESIFKQDLLIIHLPSALDFDFFENMLLSKLTISPDSFKFSYFPKFVLKFFVFVIRVIREVSLILIIIVVNFFLRIFGLVFA